MLRQPGAGELEALLRGEPSLPERVDVARLLGALEESDQPAGAVVITDGEPTDGQYLARGRTGRGQPVTSSRRANRGQTCGPHFGELGLLLGRRTATVRAVSDVRLWKLPRDRFEALVRERPTLGLGLRRMGGGVARTESTRTHGAPPVEPETPLVFARALPRPQWLTRRIVGVGLSVGGPLALWWVSPPSGLSPQAWHVGLVVAGAAVGWLFEPLPEFVIAMLMALTWGVVCSIPLGVAFAGFSSSSWVVTLGVFGRSVALSRLGLLFRVALLLLRVFPATHVLLTSRYGPL